jgi:hypothetical protein
MEIPSAAGNQSYNNHDLLQNDTHCGCYYCCIQYPVSEIHNWVDNNNTAVCPICKIDAVIPRGGMDAEDFADYLEYLCEIKFAF